MCRNIQCQDPPQEPNSIAGLQLHRRQKATWTNAGNPESEGEGWGGGVLLGGATKAAPSEEGYQSGGPSRAEGGSKKKLQELGRKLDVRKKTRSKMRKGSKGEATKQGS